MNKRKFLFWAIAFFSINNLHAQGATSICACSHSFFSIRPPFQNSTPENITLFRDAALRRDCGWGGAIEVVGFGGRSTRAKDLARFFTPNCSDTIIFAESQFDAVQTNPNARDVNATFFNIRTVGDNFASSVTFRPRQTFGGVGFAWKQYLGWWQCNTICPRWWFEVSFPVLHVRNTMKLKETILNQGTKLNDNVYTSVIDAFTCTKPFVNLVSGDTGIPVTTGVGAKFGCIDGARKKTGVADFEFKLGYDFLQNECCHLDGYVGAVAPTGNKPKAKFVFEPIVGNNHHWGIMWGSNFGGIIWEKCDMVMRLEFSLNGRYLFRNIQRRSFDVNGKPWSRYMLVYPNSINAATQRPVEGINFFTQKLHVKPRIQQHINTGLVFDWCNLQAELGYHLWAAQCERVSLKDAFPTGLAFARLTIFDATSPSLINRAITIKENFSGVSETYSDLLAIRESDLNLASAAMPCAITHSIYGSLGYNVDWCWPIFLGVGGSYEWTPKRVNTALNRWIVWGKVGMAI